MTGLDFLAVCLAAWRTAVFLTKEEGPWGAGRRIREAAGVEHNRDGTPVSYPESMPGAALACMWCTGVWTAAAATALFTGGGKVGRGLVYTAAAAAGVALIEESLEAVQSAGPAAAASAGRRRERGL